MDLVFGSWGHWLLGCGLHRRSPAQIAGLKITDKFSKTAIAGLLLWFNTLSLPCSCCSVNGSSLKRVIANKLWCIEASLE
jgi:hypothetical protein